jgi:DNA-binding GntR family transcriptional regulator
VRANDVRAVTRADGVGVLIREAISHGELVPGSLHSVQKLATQLGVSRTPVREALLGLAKDGLVQFERNRGFRVLEKSVHDFEEIFELREWLEVPATHRATKRGAPDEIARIRTAVEAMASAEALGNVADMWRHDGEFHDALLDASGNRRVARLVGELRSHVLRINNTSLDHGRTPAEIVAAHREILCAVESGAAERAARLMRDYLRRTRQILAEHTAREPGAGEPSGGRGQGATGM